MAIPTALRDARMLARQLTAVGRGERALRDAVGEYESEMRAYSRGAVDAAVQTKKNQLLPSGSLSITVARAWMRLCRAVPLLRRHTFGSGFADPA